MGTRKGAIMCQVTNLPLKGKAISLVISGDFEKLVGFLTKISLN